MKAAYCAILLLTLAASASAFRTQDLLSDFMQNAEQVTENAEGFLAAMGHSLEKGDKGPKTFAVIKYVVAPSKAKSFISEIEKAKEGAEKAEGFITYHLLKTGTDNLLYWAFGAWESPEYLLDYLKSDSAKELMEYITKEDIPIEIVPVKPIL